MKTDIWLIRNTSSLSGKTIGITGSTGGLGRAICKYIAMLGGSLILLDRNAALSSEHARELEEKYKINVRTFKLDLEDIDNVAEVTDKLKNLKIDCLIHNAGAYSIPRRKCKSGYDNVFQINFLSPYYMIRELAPVFKITGGRFIIVGSIAHNYSKIDKNDVDFSTRTASSKVYGNAKRWLMCASYSLIKEQGVDISVTHPGISFTNITAHYPRLIFAVIKHPMKIIFMKPDKACLSVIRGIFDNTSFLEWIGPRMFDVWGSPSKKRLKTISENEISYVSERSENIYNDIKKDYNK